MNFQFRYSVAVIIFFFCNIGEIGCQNEDCITALRLCNKNKIIFDSISNVGNNNIENEGTCLAAGIPHTDSPTKWLYWLAKNNGKLTFTITPTDSFNDIDFALFELPLGPTRCDSRKILRCNATSPSFSPNWYCNYITGLNLSSVDFEEDLNCDVGEDGFCKYLDMEQGHFYGLMISNFSHSGSKITIDWGGDGLFSDEGCTPVNTKTEVTISGFYINPNPVNDRLTISFQTLISDESVVINIRDVHGKLLNSFNTIPQQEFNIDVHDLIPGTYYIENIIGKNRVVSRMFIKK